MSMHEIIVLTDVSLITCIVQRGAADNIIAAARAAGAQGATVHYGRGMGVRERLGRLGGKWRDVVFLERRSRVAGN